MGSSTIGKTDKAYSTMGLKGDLPANRDTRSYGPAPKAVGGKVDVQKPSTAKNQGQRPSWGTAMLTRQSKYSTAPYEPGAYAAYRQAMPDILTKKFVTKKPAAVVKPAAKKLATVVSNVTNEKLSPTKAAPRGMAINPRTGDTTGFTTGKTTGTSASKPGVAGKTYQSAGDRMKANAMNRTNQPAGPMGGGGRGGSLGGGTGPSRSSGGGNLGGARGRISEPGGSKR